MYVIWSLSPRDLILYRATRMRVGAERGCCGVWLLHCKGSYTSCTWLCWVLAAPFDELTTCNTLFGIITKLKSMHSTYGQCRHSVEEWGTGWESWLCRLRNRGPETKTGPRPVLPRLVLPRLGAARLLPIWRLGYQAITKLGYVSSLSLENS